MVLFVGITCYDFSAVRTYRRGGRRHLLTAVTVVPVVLAATASTGIAVGHRGAGTLGRRALEAITRCSDVDRVHAVLVAVAITVRPLLQTEMASVSTDLALVARQPGLVALVRQRRVRQAL